jgi:hypothetical protein
VELYNGGPDEIDVSGYGLSDDPLDPLKYMLPASTTIPAGGFHVPAYGQGENVTIEPMSRIRQLTAGPLAEIAATCSNLSTEREIQDYLRSSLGEALLAPVNPHEA